MQICAFRRWKLVFIFSLSLFMCIYMLLLLSLFFLYIPSLTMLYIIYLYIFYLKYYFSLFFSVYIYLLFVKLFNILLDKLNEFVLLYSFSPISSFRLFVCGLSQFYSNQLHNFDNKLIFLCILCFSLSSIQFFFWFSSGKYIIHFCW